MKYFFHKPLHIFLAIALVVASGMFLTQTPTVLAACSISEPAVSNTLTSITPSSQTFTDPSTIFINASGHTAFKCIDGNGFRSTTLTWTITNGLGQTMVSDSWNSPGTWDNQVAAGAVNYDGTPFGFVNGFSGTTIDVSSWPAGIYTLTLTSDSEVETVGTNVSLNSTITITRPSACAISSFTCDGDATLAWNTSDCSSRSISPTIGSVVAVGNTQGTVGTTYTLTADSNTSTAHCPAPTLTSGWQENGSPTLDKTVTPGTSITVPFDFSNTGQSGSVINDTKCAGGTVTGIDPDLVGVTCDNKTLIAP